MREAILILAALLSLAGCRPSPPSGRSQAPTPTRAPDPVDEAIALEADCLSRAASGYIDETITACRRSIELFVAAGMKEDAPRLRVLRNAIATAEARKSSGDGR